VEAISRELGTLALEATPLVPKVPTDPEVDAPPTQVQSGTHTTPTLVTLAAGMTPLPPLTVQL
jgi:hypothetical protein